MKFLHISDLHFGKVIHGISMLEQGDQPFWTEKFLELTREISPDAVLIAGDVYDRAFPSGEATQLFSRLLTELSEEKIPVLICAGNHDSAERLSFAAELLARQNVHISRPLQQGAKLTRVTLRDAFGPVNFYLMPYLFPSLAARALGEKEFRDTESAVRALLEAQGIDFTQRNVILAHQYVTENGQDPRRGGSESMLGGVGQIDFHVFDGFEYAALGHIHAAYPVGRRGVRYAGSPLCYHFEETKQQQKGPVLVTLGEKGTEAETEVRLIPPLHPMREIRGPWEEIREAETRSGRREEYLRVVITDRKMLPEHYDYFHTLAEARGSVLMAMTSEYQAFRGGAEGATLRQIREKPLEQLFLDFYAERHGGEGPAEKDRELLTALGKIVRGADTSGEVAEEDVEQALKILDGQEEKA